MKRIKKRYVEAALLTALSFIWIWITYSGSRLIASSWYHHDVTIECIDSLIPVVPWTVVIYFGCYVFWIVNYFICGMGEDDSRDRFFCADAIAKAVCLVIYIAYPSTNVRPEIGNSNIWDSVMHLLYTIDSADNLFPSIHCLVSWFCFIGVRRRKDVSVGYKLFSLIAALAVFVSTLTTKQHVVIDVAGGVILAELTYLIAGIPKVRNVYGKFFSALLSLLKIDKYAK